MSEALKGLRVMVIDDSNTIRRSAEIHLREDKNKNPTGIDVMTVENGLEALTKIFDAKPQIIFLDVTMPGIDGFTLCSAIKGNPLTMEIKVIMLTSKDGIFDRARGENARADDYITKPFSRETIMEAVVRHSAPQAAA